MMSSDIAYADYILTFVKESLKNMLAFVFSALLNTCKQFLYGPSSTKFDHPCSVNFFRIFWIVLYDLQLQTKSHYAIVYQLKALQSGGF